MPIDNPYYSAAVHGDFELADIGDLVLEEGATLRGCQLAYQTLGTLNAAKDNAVLIPTWYSGNHSVMRDTYVGSGRAIDPAEHFVVLVNQIGSGLGTSPHNLAGPYGRSRFPRVRIGDDVVAQERLLREHFGIEKLQLVIGGSMGAQQTYEWAVRFPDKVLRAAPIAGTAQNTPHDFLYTKALMDAIT
jgi:homoserine O-acetyltransferase/O-succinyltransferase